MKVLLDTNIIIHRETGTVIAEEIGLLFRWIDNLNYNKYIHPVTVQEIERYSDHEVVRIFKIKMKNYNELQTTAPLHPALERMSIEFDGNENDYNDTLLLNEVFSNRVDVLITEDRKIHKKAERVSIAHRVFTIDSFLEKVSAENPDLIDYKVLSVRKEFFGNIDLNDPFFGSFKEDYVEFEKWFNKKSDEIAYICKSGNNLIAFLYLKIEGMDENYSDIKPIISRGKRLKIGTFKVSLNGFKIGERFLKIIFDNALNFQVEEIYITAFEKRIEQERLIALLKEFGFSYHGIKYSASGEENVYVWSFNKDVNISEPTLTYPLISLQSNCYLVAIYPSYHTELLPDSILRTESPDDFVENQPYRNAIRKVFISRSIERNLSPGDNIIFYRTRDRGPAIYTSVISTVGIIEKVYTDIEDEDLFLELCRKRSVFTDSELRQYWNYNPSNRPFIVHFLYVYSFPKRINLEKLIEIGVIEDIGSAPRGFKRISKNDFENIIKETQTNERIIIN